MKKLLYLLSFFSFWSYFSISILGFNAKLDQLMTILVLGIFILHRVLFGRGVYIDKGGFLLILLCMISLFSSYFNAPDPSYSLVQTVNLFSVALAYFIIPNVLTTYDDLSDFLKVQLRIAKIWLIVSALVFLFSYSTNKEVFGVNLVQNESVPFGVYATMLEPNIFGSFMLVIFFLSFALSVSGSELGGMRRSELRTIMIWAIVGIFISFTRGVWLGALVGVGFYYLFKSENIVRTVRQMAFLSIAALVLVYVAGEVLEIGFVKYKISNFFTSESGTGQMRLLLWGKAVNNWIEEGNTFFGSGTYSYASFFNTYSYEARSNEWIGNVYITFLHDTGVVGLLVFLLFCGRLAFSTVRNAIYYRLDEYRIIKNLNLGFLLALLGIGIAFFFTTALTFSYPWILFGTIAAFSRINKKNLKDGVVEEKTAS